MKLEDNSSEAFNLDDKDSIDELINAKRNIKRHQQVVKIGKFSISKFWFVLMLAAIFSFGITVISIVLVVFTSSSVSVGRHIFKEAAVASENAVCSSIGKDVLLNGGNAIDATIASLLCVGIIDSFSSGIGGGGFMLIRLADGTLDSIDFREVAPQKAFKDMYKEHPDWSMTSKNLLIFKAGLSVAVPGEIKGFFEAHKKYGKLPWKSLFEPNIALARDGFKVTNVLARRLEHNQAFIMKEENFRKVYAPEGTLLKEGEICYRKNYAELLQAIGDNGGYFFYNSWIAESLVNFVKERGGIMEISDIQNYKVVFRKPIMGTYRGNSVFTMGPPTSGPIALQILNFLEGYDFTGGESDLNIHRMVESFKYAYASRTELGDPEFVSIEDRVDLFIDKNYASLLRSNTSDFTTYDVKHYNPKFMNSNSEGTTHVSVIDKEGNAVSCTSTINLTFGSKLMHDTGIIMNNQMNDFSIPGVPDAFGLKPSPNNFIAGGKRPLSSSTPMIAVKDGKVVWIGGASGGSKIPHATLETFIYNIDWKFSITAASRHPRFHHQLFPNKVSVEAGFHDSFVKGLENRNHNVEFLNPADYGSAFQGISRDSSGLLEATSDHRKQGQPDGY